MSDTTCMCDIMYAGLCTYKICTHGISHIHGYEIASSLICTQRFTCDTKYRVAKTHRIPYLYRSFSAKLTYI